MSMVKRGDTAAAARQFLLDASEFDPIRIRKAKAVPDPSQKGVWYLLGAGEDDAPDVCVYLPGISCEHGDFECGTYKVDFR